MLNVSRILVFVTIAAFLGTSGIAIAQNAPPPPMQSQPMTGHPTTGQPMPGQPTTGQPKKKKGCKIKGCPKNQEKKAAAQAQQAGGMVPPAKPPQ